MNEATNGTFEVQEQSLYRALRRFKGMKMVEASEEESPGSGPKRKFYSLTPTGIAVLAAFIELHIEPLTQPRIRQLLAKIKEENS